jgi:hypothetical protein
MATCLFHQNGRMECRNVGMLGIKAELKHYNYKKLLQTHHFYPVKLFSISPGPLLHYSTIPIGVKPLSSILSTVIKWLADLLLSPG